LREGKLKPEPADINTISDPRNYLYVDLRATQSGSAISVEATSPKQPKPSVSDLGDTRLRIDRSGYFRTAIRLDSFEGAAATTALTIHCYSALGHDCQDVEVKSASTLDRNYHPRFFQIENLPPRTLKPNETLTISLH
jgi:hypothetical protein